MTDPLKLAETHEARAAAGLGHGVQPGGAARAPGDRGPMSLQWSVGGTLRGGPDWLLVGSEIDEDSLLALLRGAAMEEDRPDVTVEAADFVATLRSALGRALSRLTDRERAVICARYGLPPYNEPVRLIDCESIFGVCRERVRQIQSKAEARLTSLSVGRELCVLALGATSCRCGHGWDQHYRIGWGSWTRSRPCAYAEWGDRPCGCYGFAPERSGA